MEGEGLRKKATLNDGHKMPMFGLGVYMWCDHVEGEALKTAKCALKNGYRLIDTAEYYGQVGRLY